MIYYFSGTGNSRYAAEKLARMTGDKCVSIASVFNGNPPDVVGRSDVTGFVFPVYFSGLPEMVRRFASHREVKSHLGFYVYSVITCGASGAAAGDMLSRALGRKVDLCVHVPMPDNYVMVYEPCEPEKAKKMLRKADAALEEIGGYIEQRATGSRSTLKMKLMTKFTYPLYDVFRRTNFFRVTNKCTSCGLCERLCPDKAVKMKAGRPVWTKKKCQHCTACINNCPVKAIQFGPLTAKRGRYSITRLK